jgi:hypothetical protein
MALPCTLEQLTYKLQDSLRGRYGDCKVVRSADRYNDDDWPYVMIVPPEGDDLYIIEIRKAPVLGGDRESTNVWGDNVEVREDDVPSS